MKKLFLFAIVVVLTGCSIPRTYATTTCISGTDVVTINSYHEEILLWEVWTTYDRAEFESLYLPDIYMTDNEIKEVFTRYSNFAQTGITVGIIDINADEVTVFRLYDYSRISSAVLEEMWGVDDFFEEINLSVAIAGFEELGVICEIVVTSGEENGD